MVSFFTRRFECAQIWRDADIGAGRQLEQRLHPTSKQGCPCIDARAFELEFEILVQQRVGAEDMFLINTALLKVNFVFPEQVVGGDGCAIDPLQSGLSDFGEDVVQRDEIIPAGDAVFVVDDGIIDQVDALRNICAFVILLCVSIAHTSEGSHGIADNHVPFDVDDPVGDVRVVDNLDAIFAVAGDDVVTDFNVERGAAVSMQSNLDTIVLAVANQVVGDDHFAGAIEVYRIVLIVLKGVELTNATSIFVVDGIIVIDKSVVKDMSVPAASDAVVPVLNGESDNFQIRAGLFSDFDNEVRLLSLAIFSPDTSFEYGSADVIGVFCIQKARRQRDIFPVYSYHLVINSRIDKHDVAVISGVNSGLNVRFVLWNANCSPRLRESINATD